MQIVLEPAYVNGVLRGGPGAINMVIAPESVFPNYWSKPIDNHDLEPKQYTEEILGKLGEDFRKIISQNVNCRPTKILSLENKIEFYNKRADSAVQFFCQNSGKD